MVTSIFNIPIVQQLFTKHYQRFKANKHKVYLSIISRNFNVGDNCTSRNLHEKRIQIRLPVNSRYEDWITIFEALL